MKTVLKWLILAPIAVLIVTFAIVNRQIVSVNFDPFGSTSSGMSIDLPLFLIMFGCAMIGVVAGSLATWVAQGRHRRALRDARSDLAHLREEAERARHFAALPGTDRSPL